MHYKSEYTESHALVIGIGEYADPAFSTLTGAVGDANDIARVLSSDIYGFHVRLLLNEQATKAAILDALNDLQMVDPDSRSVVFFSGHGERIRDKFGRETGVIFAHDSRQDNRYTCLNLDDVTSLRGFTKGKHVLFIFDSCFSGKALGLTKLKSAAERYLEQTAYQVLTAGGDEVVTDERSMTHFLLPLLECPQGPDPLRLTALFPELQDMMVRARCVQTPQAGHLEGSGGGDFVFYMPPAHSPWDDLSEDLRAALKGENPLMRRMAISEAEKWMRDPQVGEAVRVVLKDLQYDDPDRDVRRRIGEALEDKQVSTPAVSNQSFVASVLTAISPARLTTSFVLPMLEWCEIPEGVEGIPTFWMSKYPITNAQFQAFLNAPDGYQNKQCWEGLAMQETSPQTPNWSDSKCPRETVNWYETIAFCCWLSHKMEVTVTLPTEGQWQRAAQGDYYYQYPWGDEFDTKRCNTSESGIGRTTPVDKYPTGASPFGVMDMSGNVWEWCLNEYEAPGSTDLGGTNARVLRGGSWYLYQSYARCSFRYGDFPSSRYFDLGFRVCVSSSSPFSVIH